MNYYERYCGDYGRDTSHLSMAQHGAYTLMLDSQYSTERGLPMPYDPLYRVCGAISKAEQACVRSVADEYFPVADDGMRWNPRARRDIAAAQVRIGRSKVNGCLGGRPAKKPTGNLPGSHEEPRRNLPATSPGEASPDSIPHTPPKPLAAAPPGVDDENWRAWLKHKGKKQTPDADRIQRKRLAEWAATGHDVNRIVEDAVAAKWLGFVDPSKIARGREPTLAERRVRNMDLITGKARDERTINGTAERVDQSAVLALPGDLRQPSGDDVGRREHGGGDDDLGGRARPIRGERPA